MGEKKVCESSDHPQHRTSRVSLGRGGPTLDGLAETAETRPPGLERHDHDQTGLSSAAQSPRPELPKLCQDRGAGMAGGRERRPEEEGLGEAVTSK